MSVGATVTPVVPILSKTPPTIIGGNEMTRLEALRTVISCDKYFEEQLAGAEILFVDLGATAEELEAAIGPDGFCRKMLEEDRDAQIAAVARWLSGKDGTLH